VKNFRDQTALPGMASPSKYLTTDGTDNTDKKKQMRKG
jgi:hypothetical protein